MRTRTLLLADDNLTVQRVIALTFAQEPVRIVTASDGHQAMDRVIVERPDIVLAGTTLPQVNGYDLARFVKSKAELKNVPVLLLSGAFETVDEAQLESSGANGVVEKPIEPVAVVNRVRELLGIRFDDMPGPGGRLAEGDPSDREQVLPKTTPAAVMTSRPMPPIDSRPLAGAEGAPTLSTNTDDYLTSLRSAFDSLDDQLDGRAVSAAPRDRTSAPGRESAEDRRAPAAPAAAPSEPANPVYEVDDDWFAEWGGRSDESPQAAAPPTARSESSSHDIYEVDEEWFKEDDKARELREMEHRQLAAEMGINDLAEITQTSEGPGVAEAPPVEAALEVETVVSIAETVTTREVVLLPEVPELSRPQHVEQVHQAPARPMDVHVQHITEPSTGAAAPEPPFHAETESATEYEPIPRTLPIDWFAKGGSHSGPSPRRRDLIEIPKVAPIPNAVVGSDGAPLPPGRVADDFAALLAFEQGEKKAPPIVEPIIHAVTPEITPEMLEQIASSVADKLKGSIHVEPKAPEVSGEMLSTIAALVSGSLKDSIHVEPAAPVITDTIVEQMSGLVADRLRDTVRVEPKAPEIDDEMLQRVAENVATRLKDSIRVEPAIPELNGSMLDQIAGTVAERLSGTVRDNLRVETVAPEITGDMLEHIAHRVSERVQANLPAPPPPPQITDEMLDGIAARVADRVQGTLSMDAIRRTVVAEVRETVRSVVAETSERLVREEIERIKSQAH
jgi:CheY-like chemotaxis protein